MRCPQVTADETDEAVPSLVAVEARDHTSEPQTAIARGKSEQGLIRPLVARERARVAREMLRNCRLCAHDCGVNRLAGQRGLCRTGADTRYFSAQVDAGDEAELTPSFAVALSGCDLRCDFCITGLESWDSRAVATFDPDIVAAKAQRALAAGARTVMILGGEPTIHLPAALEFVATMPPEAILVWKTNAHGSRDARDLLEGLFNIWVADFKFGNDDCAQRLARVPRYGRVVRENLLWAFATSELIVRHLVMPGHLTCCWTPIAQWLSAELPRAKVSLRAGFWPAWHSARHPEFQGVASRSEAAQALKIARDNNLNLVN